MRSMTMQGNTLEMLTVISLLAILSTGIHAQTPDENAKANELFHTFFEEALARSPMRQTYLGLKTRYDQWDDLSAGYQRDTDKLLRNQLLRLRQLDLTRLDEETTLSYHLMEAALEQRIGLYRWRHYAYPVNQMFGTHTEIASLLINSHKIDNTADAQAYISRVRKVPVLINQLIALLEESATAGVIPPKFVFPLVISSSENLIKGAPFDTQQDSPLLTDFRNKLARLNLSTAEHDDLIKQLEVALVQAFKPAYNEFITYWVQLEKRADERAGVWKLPQGQAYYEFALAFNTTTSLSTADIHSLGLNEVKRIHDEIRGLMKKLEFKGSLQEFFQFMRDDERFYFPNTDEGRAAYLREATAIIDEMKPHLDSLFITQPKAALNVQRVELFREKTAGKAFYKAPATNGSRPGIYYANLYNMKNMPVYQMQALAYHEGIPGHHMQIATAQEKTGLPKFRQYARYTAFVEGWALYAELLPLEMGLYKDDYAKFGRLALELWRACRLVVDTGIHARRWTREESIQFLLANTPNAEQDIIKAVERYIVMPGQATAYTLGMKKILGLREQARTELGDAFDLRAFHDQIMQGGAMPLTLLEVRIVQWIAQEKKRVTHRNKNSP